MKKHEEEINEVYKRERAKNIDVDINAIVLERKEARQNKKRIEAIIKSEKEKWALLKKNQELKKQRANFSNYDKYIIQEPNQIRILVLGESFSGKTSFIRRFIKNEFSPEYITTTSIESFKSELLFFEEDSYKVELIDTPPLEKFYPDLNSFLYFAQGVIFLFDASSKNSFLRMQDYFKITSFYDFQKTGIIATKKDICKEKDKYKYHQLKKFCEEHDSIPFFLSAKNGKKEIYQFINLLCPAIIPSILNRKKEIKLAYPFTKTVKNNFPKENYLDKAIIKKLQEDDSSYESEKEVTVEKNKEDIIKEYLLKKEIEKSKIKKKKINTMFNVGNNNKINYDYKNRNFNDVIGMVNLDLEKLFKKYRPDSKESKKRKNKYDNINKKDKFNINNINIGVGEERKNVKDKEEEEEWASVNVDDLIEQFMKTKDEFNKKVSKNIQKEKEKEEKKEKEKEEKKEKEKKEKESVKKNKNEKKSIQIDNEEKEEEKEEEKLTEQEKENIEEKSKKENIEEKEEEKEKSEDKEEGKEKDDDKEEENIEEEEKEVEEEEGKSLDKKDKKGDSLSDDNYENLSDDLNEFQQSLMNEDMGQ